MVTGEVKALANETARATEQIGAQVAAMQAATGEAVAAIRGIDRTISQINEISTTVASAVEQQGSAAHEITRSTTGLGAAEVLSSSSELAAQTNRLRHTSSTGSWPICARHR